jgi:glycogen(starch) synthase
LRVLYQCNAFLPSVIGGTEILSYNLVKELGRRGHEVLVVTGRAKSDAPGRQTLDGLTLVRLEFDAAVASRRLPALLRSNGSVAELAGSFQPDILHLNDTGLGSIFFLRGGATGYAPRILTFHSPIRPPDKLGLQGRMAKDVDQIIAVSQANLDATVAAMPWAQSKTSLILNALPLPNIKPAALQFAPPLLLCLGRLFREKGFDVAIRAYAHLLKGGSTAKLTIAGNGPEKSNLESLARDLGVGENIDFINWVSPDCVPSLINTATLVLIPSTWPEPFGLVALQAAQMGRPAIASAVGGLPEIIAHGQTGLLIERKNERVLADAIETLLSDPALAVRLGMNAFNKVQEKFNFGGLVDAYELAYATAQNLSGRRPRNGEWVA